MLLKVIIGTILWAVILGFLSKYVEIFATPMAWLISWAVVVFLVVNVFDSVGASKDLKKLTQEAEVFDGAWSGEGADFGIRALDDSENAIPMDGDGFMIAIYNANNETVVGAVYPKKNEVLIQISETENHTMKYKFKGIFSKKLILKTEENENLKYKKVNSSWNYYLE